MSDADRCQRCPTPADVRCVGLDVRRYCELLDPSCPEHDPRYAAVVVDRSNEPEPPPVDLLTAGITIAVVAGCCNDVPPGVYDP